MLAVQTGGGGGGFSVFGVIACLVILAIVVTVRVRTGRWPRKGHQVGPFRDRS